MALEEVTLPDTLETIKKCTFESCSQLKRYICIQAEAFYGCSHLYMVELPSTLPFADVAAVSKAMIGAMQWAVGNKIISGKSGGTLLDPKGEASRIEVAAMVMNYCKKFQ